MRYATTVLLLISSSYFCQAQTHELGVFVGGSNFIGDVGSTAYISPNKPAVGAIYKWNRSPRHAFRASVIYTELEGKDSKSDDPRRQNRNFKFKNEIIEASVGVEFTFFDWDLHDDRLKATPYIYSGFSVAYHDNFFIKAKDETKIDETGSYAYGIPMVLGFKTNILGNFIIAAEIGARYTFTDEIDGNVPDYNNEAPEAFGNTNNNDWYMFTGITLTYTFGRKPCFCIF